MMHKQGGVKMGKYRKKPVVIDAWQITDEEHLLWIIQTCCTCTLNREVIYDSKKRKVEIRTLEGVVTGKVGDWIILGVSGEYYPCKNDIFLLTYEPVTE